MGRSRSPRRRHKISRSRSRSNRRYDSQSNALLRHRRENRLEQTMRNNEIIQKKILERLEKLEQDRDPSRYKRRAHEDVIPPKDDSGRRSRTPLDPGNDTDCSTGSESSSSVLSNKVKSSKLHSVNAKKLEENEGDEVLELSPQIDPDLLEILGELPPEKILEGKNIHPEVATRWEHIIRKGLDLQSSADIITKYPPAGNCKPLKVPKLNAEIDLLLSDSLRKRDECYANLQLQLTSGISAFGQVLSSAVSNNGNLSAEDMKTMNDAGKIFVNIHHNISEVRKSILKPTFPATIKKPAAESEVGEWLFGDNLQEKLKTAKDLAKVASDLTQKSSASSGPTTRNKRTTNSQQSKAKTGRTAKTDRSLNFQGPSRSNRNYRLDGRKYLTRNYRK